MEHLKAPPPLTLTRKVISYWAEECLKDLQETMAVEGIWHADFSVLVFCTKEQLLTLREERGELHSFSQMFLFFYSLEFCVWLCWLLLFVSLLSGTLSCLLQCWPEILCAMTFLHQGPETQLFNSPWSYIPCTSAFVPRPPHLEHFLSPALHTQTQDSSGLPLLQYSVQTPLSLGRSLWSAQLENASPLFELRRIAYGSYHCRLCFITLWTLSETTFNTLELKTWIDFSLGFKIIVSSIMCSEWVKE